MPTTSFSLVFCFVFFIAPPTSEIYTLSLHDALPIWSSPASYRHDHRLGHLREPARPAHDRGRPARADRPVVPRPWRPARRAPPDRKSTRLNSSHMSISYAVFCLKKKNIREAHCRELT